MRIGIDIRCFAGGKNTGVEEYTKNFLHALFTGHAQHEYVLFYNAYNDQGTNIEWLSSYENVIVAKFAYPNKILNLLLWYLQYPKIDKILEEHLRRLGRSEADATIDLCFVPNQTFAAFSREMPWIMTVHDLSAEHYKSSFSMKQRLWHWLVNPRSMIKRASHIITVSHATKQDVCASYGIRQNNITTLLSAKTEVRGDINRNSPSILEVRERYRLPRHFFLYFGTIEPRKNLISLIRSFEVYKDEIKKIQERKGRVPTHLILAGTRGWKMKEVLEYADKSSEKESIIFIHDIPSKDREALFVLSDAFVYPSHFEGFGFPPLEALVTRTPVITSHTSALPEVTAHHAILVDPTRTEELAQALISITTQNELVSSLTSEDEISRHLRGFSWERAADIFINKIAKRTQRSHPGSQGIVADGDV